MFYIGVVEDRNDPQRMGRVRVRVLGKHSENKNEIPTEALPWAQVMTPSTTSSMTGISENPYLVEGSWVVVIFSDPNMQDPVVLGSLPSMPTEQRPKELGFADPNGVYPMGGRINEPDLHRRSRGLDYGENAYAGIEGIDAPESGWDPFDADYPYNSIRGYESGHYKEYDNTPSKERIKEYHRAGTFYEVHPNGDKVTRIASNNWNITIENETAFIGGNLKVVVIGDAQIEVQQNANVEVTEDATVTVGGYLTAQAENDITIGSERDVYIKGWNIKVDSRSDGRIDFNYQPQEYEIDFETYEYGILAFGSPGGSGTEGSVPGGPYVAAPTQPAGQEYSFFDTTEIDPANDSIGATSARYESNGNPGAIGWDSTGGSSYGEYQIAAKVGSMDNYLDFLEAKEPEIYEELTSAGAYKFNSLDESVNSDFGQKWKELAQTNQDFVRTQHAFIEHTHYTPMSDRIKSNLGVDISERSLGVKDAVWSTAVQHGPRSRIINNAFANGGITADSSDADIINAIYDERSKVDTYFASSSDRVKSAVANRFTRERADALKLVAN